jgi:hypothetical protein
MQRNKLTPKIKEKILDLLGRLSIIDWCYRHHCYMKEHGYEGCTECPECTKEWIKDEYDNK